eukprot:139892_1
MMDNLFHVTVILLLNVINAQYETIWGPDNMNSKGSWVCGGDKECDFGYSSSNCPNGGTCHRVLGGNSYITRTTSISEYSALRFKFDVDTNNIESSDNDKCELWIRYDGTTWTREWFEDKSQTFFSPTVYLPNPSGAASIEIALEVNADGDPSGGSDRCYYDNALLEGIKITPAPTYKPTISPTKIPTISPTYIPTKTPTYKPTEAPVTPGSPTKAPSATTSNPTSTPTKTPTLYPTSNPSSIPTKYPTINPTKYPTVSTSIPTKTPTKKPTYVPSQLPTDIPTASPFQATMNSDTGEEKTQNDNEGNIYLLDLILYACGGIICCLVVITVILIIKYRKNRREEHANDKDNIQLSRITSVSTTIATDNIVQKIDKGEPSKIQLASWLKNISLMEYYDIFTANGYTQGQNLMTALSETTNDDLKEMGIKKVAHRKLILNQIKQDQNKTQNMEMKQDEKAFAVEVIGQEIKVVEGQILNAHKKTSGYESDGSKSKSSSSNCMYQTSDRYITPTNENINVPYNVQ